MTREAVQPFNDLAKFTLLSICLSSFLSYVIFIIALIKHYYKDHWNRFFKGCWNCLCKGWNCLCNKRNGYQRITSPPESEDKGNDEPEIQLHPFNDSDDEGHHTKLNGNRRHCFCIFLWLNLIVLLAIVIVFITGQYALHEPAKQIEKNTKTTIIIEWIEGLTAIAYFYSHLCTITSCFIFSKLMYGIQRKIINQEARTNEIITTAVNNSIVTTASSSEFEHGLKIIIHSGRNSINDGTNIINAGSHTINDGTNYINDGSNTVNGGRNNINGGKNTINNGKVTINGGTNIINDGTVTINGGKNIIKGGKITINGGTNTIKGRTIPIIGSTNTINDGTITVNGGMNTINGRTVLINGGTNTIKGGTITVNGGTNTIKGGTIIVNGGTNTITGGIITINGGTNTITGGIITINGGTNSIDGRRNTRNGRSNTVNNNICIAEDNTSKHSINISCTKINGSEIISNGRNIITGDLFTIKGGSNTITGGSNTIKGGSNIIKGGENTIDCGSNTINGGINTINNGSNIIISGTNKINGGLNTVIDGNNTICGGYNSFPSKLTTLMKADDTFITFATKTLSVFQLWFFVHWVFYIITSFLTIALSIEAILLLIRATQHHIQPGVHFSGFEIPLLVLVSASNVIMFFYPCFQAASITRARKRYIRHLIKKYKDDDQRGIVDPFVKYLQSREFGFRLYIGCTYIPFSLNIAYTSVIIGVFGIVLSVLTSIAT